MLKQPALLARLGHQAMAFLLPTLAATGAFHFSTHFTTDPGWVTWEAARDQCTARNQVLAVLRTKADLSAFLSAASAQEKSGSHNMFWIGASATTGADSATAASYKWVDGTGISSTGLTNWRPTKPNGSGKCVHVYKSADYQWANAPCTNKFSFVCSDLPGTAPPYPPAVVRLPPPPPPSPPPPSFPTTSLVIFIAVPVAAVALALLLGRMYLRRRRRSAASSSAPAKPVQQAFEVRQPDGQPAVALA